MSDSDTPPPTLDVDLTLRCLVGMANSYDGEDGQTILDAIACLRDSREEIARLREAVKWQPIETAPRGEYIIFADELNVIPGFWNPDKKEPRMIHTGGEFPIWPTHWCRMLEAPGRAAKALEG